MESFFRAVRNEFELNQHFEEDLLDQVILVYRVTGHHVVLKLVFTSKQNFHFSIQSLY